MPTPHETPGRSSTMLYRPFGLTGSIGGGLLAGMIFKRLWARFAPGGQDNPPTARGTDYPLKQIVIAALLQGALYSLVKATIDRGGAHLFQRLTGEWPSA